MELDPQKVKEYLDAPSADWQYDYLSGVARIRREDAARALGLSVSTGLTREDVLSNPNLRVENLIKPWEFERLGYDYPEVQQFLSDPVHMAIVRDRESVRYLTDMEDNHNYLIDFANGFKTIIPATLGYVKAAADNLAELDKADLAARGQHSFMADLSEILGWAINAEMFKATPNALPENASLPQKVGQMIAENAPQVVAHLAIALYSGGASAAAQTADGAGKLAAARQLASKLLPQANAGTAFMASQIAGAQYNQLTADGVAPDRAAIAATLNGLLQGQMENWSIGKALGVGGRGAGKLLLDILSEGGAEALQTFPEKITDIWARNQDKDISEQVDLFAKDFDNTLTEAGYSGLVGFIFGAGFAGAGSVARRVAHKAQTEALEKDMSSYQGITKSTGSPDIGAAALNAKGEVYVEASTVQTYAQTAGEKVIEDLGYAPEDVADAAAKGEMLTVPRGDFVKATEEHQGLYEAVKKDIAFDGDGMSESRISIQNEKVIKEARQEIQRQADELKVETDKIISDMRNAGMPPTKAQDGAAMLTALAKTASANPAEWLREHAPEFVKGGEAGQYNQAMYLSNAKDILEFRNNVVSGKSGKAKFVFSSSGNAEITIGYSHIKHFHGANNRALTDAELSALANNIENIEEYAYTEGTTGLNTGQVVLTKINTPAGKFGVTFEYQPSGGIYIVSAFISTDNGIDAWIKKEGAHALAVSKTFKQGGPFSASHPSSISTIQQQLGIVKSELNQFAGQRSQMSDTVRQNLDTAQSLEEQGQSKEDILKQTGWFRGIDGQWRYEIPDNLNKINFDKVHEYQGKVREFQGKVREFQGDGVARLGDIYDNEALYTAYPQLKGLTVNFEDMPSGTGGHLNRENTGAGVAYGIDINKKSSPKKKATTLLHEVQHIIQFIEGFAEGSSPDMFSGKIVLSDKATEAASIVDSLARKTPGVYRVGNSFLRILRNELGIPIEGLDFSYLMDFIQDDPFLTKEFEAGTALFGENFREYIQAAHKERLEASKSPILTSYNQYTNTAGAIEARDTVSRAEYSPRERIERFPRQEQIAVNIVKCN